eukprot:COSAG06_NODE_276_length_18571_cov_4.278421_1_plen_125_part_10
MEREAAGCGRTCLRFNDPRSFSTCSPKLPYTCWSGFAPVLYGQAVKLLPPVFVALARRLEDPTTSMVSASMDTDLFDGLTPQDAPTEEVRALQRKLFPKDKPRESEEGWPQWAMPPTKAAAENFD